jgi:DNA-binding transcriptional LysR family regulator
LPALPVSPMAASRRLAALEEDLGVRLMHRTTQSIALTAEGEVFVRHAQAILAEARQARASVKPDQAALTGTLRITASLPFGCKVPTPMLAHFKEQRPDRQAHHRQSQRALCGACLCHGPWPAEA